MPDETSVVDVVESPVDGAVDTPTETPSTEAAEPIGTPTEQQGEQRPIEDAEEIAHFGQSVSAKLRDFAKRNPDLANVLQKDPAFRNAIEASFRREQAYRELYATPAEARAVKEALPGGVEELQTILAEVEEIQAVDSDFETRAPDGKYPGHARLIDAWQRQDPKAFQSLLNQAVSDWPRYDPQGYNKALSGIIGETFAQHGVLEAAEQLSKSDDPQVKQLANYLLRWDPQRKQAARPTEQDEQFRREREQFDRERQEASERDRGSFVQTLDQKSEEQARSIIMNHPLIRRLPQAISPAMRTDLVDTVLRNVSAVLGKNRSFLSSMRSAMGEKDLSKALTVQRVAWSQPWVLNWQVRKVLNEKTPGIVQANKGARKAPVAQARPATPANGSDGRATAGPKQGPDGRWYKTDGQAFTVEEMLRGAHLKR